MLVKQAPRRKGYRRAAATLKAGRSSLPRLEADQALTLQPSRLTSNKQRPVVIVTDTATLATTTVSVPVGVREPGAFRSLFQDRGHRDILASEAAIPEVLKLARNFGRRATDG
jgi:hypothetical protein